MAERLEGGAYRVVAHLGGRASFRQNSTPAHVAGSIGWAKGFATGAHAFETPNGATTAELTKKPALAIWGEADWTLHAEHFLPLFSQAVPSGQVLRLPGAGQYSPEDAPEEIARLVAEFAATSAG